MDIGFHCFDVSADGNVEAKVNHKVHSFILVFHVEFSCLAFKLTIEILITLRNSCMLWPL